MVFSDLFFLFVFIPSFMLCYLTAMFIDKKLSGPQTDASNTTKNFVLVVFSLLFYAWGEPVYVFLMLFCVLMNYFVGRGIEHFDGGKRKAMLVVGLVVNISILGTFKYLGFFASVLNDMGVPVAQPKIALPIGISFYTFQSISYLIDVYRRESPVQKRFLGLLLYISMFPQLIAGPIVRYGTVAEEIGRRHVSPSDFAEGIYRFLIGLGKKVILANQLSESTNLLQRAIRARRQVILHHYESPHRQTDSDRLVEPFRLLTATGSVRCYEPSTDTCKTFKIARIRGQVEVLKQHWEHTTEHVNYYTDAFGFSGEVRHRVVLRLTMLAAQVLCEEFGVKESQLLIDPEEPSHRIFHTHVCSPVGIGRFVMGLINDVEVVRGNELNDFIRQELDRYRQR